MNINKEVSFAKCLAKSVRQSTHPATDRQIEDIVMDINKIGEICQRIKCLPSEKSDLKLLSEICQES